MRRNVNLSGREFSSLTKAKDHAKSILNKCDVGNKVSDDEKAFLLSAIVLRGQEKLAEKIGAGVDYIFVDFNEAGDSRSSGSLQADSVGMEEERCPLHCRA